MIDGKSGKWVARSPSKEQPEQGSIFVPMRFIDDESGATMVEYGLLVALLSVLLVAVLGDMGGNIVTTFGAADDGFND